eukprot:TRINITY_DN92068_c0_g1_i1.p1 TRINITY_DN92068_c0_g1~~TRINITY_DN92068_c0_g1_i1.p1  ORF type:complete len:380 (+),score=54.76 TRINITY_DN92068_c0_g1_i1:67-1206(+)
MSSWALCFCLLGAAGAHKLILSFSNTNAPTNVFITHQPCDIKNQGLGSATMCIHPMLDIAGRYNMTYVCHEKDFDSGGHNTGTLGDIFGCHSESEAYGPMISSFAKLPPGLKWKNLTVKDVSPKGSYYHMELDMDGPIESNTVYNLHDDCWFHKKNLPAFPPVMQRFGASWKFFRSQFRFVKQQHPDREPAACWRSARPGSKKIAVHIRRGDGSSRGGTVSFYKKSLNYIFGCTSHVPELCAHQNSTMLVVMAETKETDPEMQQMKVYEGGQTQVSLRLGEPETDMAKSRQRMVEDLDCMSDADILITSGGGFSALGAAVQKDEGRSLNLMYDNSRDDFPSALHKLSLAQISSSVVHSDSSMTIEQSPIPNAFAVRIAL